MTRVDEARTITAAAARGGSGEPGLSRPRRPLAVECRIVAGESGDASRRREAELERLIVKAACLRAARLAAARQVGEACAGDNSPTSGAAAGLRAAPGAR
jgi:hypothetical protein